MKRSRKKLPRCGRRDEIVRARQLRQQATHAEKLFWGLVRFRQLAGFKFRRQHPIGPYTVDFCCVEVRVVVELDGASHRGREEKDAERQRWLEQRGYRVIRFSNIQVEEERQLVMRQVLEVLRYEESRR